jgi:GT2 family glycosyltransferase
MNNISLLVGLKNNLEYSKHFYRTTREIYPEVEICFVSYGSTDGTHEWLDSISDDRVKYFYSKEPKTFSDTFNKATEIATKEYVAYLHNDIVLAPGFIENIQKHLSPDNVVSYTTVEPPIFTGHSRPGKIIFDLGIDIESFSKQRFYNFVDKIRGQYSGKTEPGITFFMALSREVLLDIGGMDNLFNPMFCEDDDLITRLKLLGLNTFTILDAICYHFVSKTSRFSHEYKDTTRQIEYHSNRNFIRKWGSRNPSVKYNIGFVVSNCNLEKLALLEPWCSNIYIQDDIGILESHYLDSEQPHTKFNLKERIRSYSFNDKNKPNDIIVEFDANELTEQDFQMIQMLPDIIQDSGEIGTFQLDHFKITIKSLETYEKNLIKNLVD